MNILSLRARDDPRKVKLRSGSGWASTGLAVWLAAGIPFAVLAAEPLINDPKPLRPGEWRVLAVYYEVRKSDCLALKAPTVRITRQPTQGTLTLVQSEGLAHTPSRCAHVAVPIRQVIYQAREPGTDNMMWEVEFQALDQGTEQAQAQLVIKP